MLKYFNPEKKSKISNWANKGISTPIAIGTILAVAIVVVGIVWWQNMSLKSASRNLVLQQLSTQYIEELTKQCVRDTDCVFIDTSLDYRSCTAYRGQTINYSAPTYLAVNIESYRNLLSKIRPSDEECYSKAAAKKNIFKHSDLTPQCIENQCSKTEVAHTLMVSGIKIPASLYRDAEYGWEVLLPKDWELTKDEGPRVKVALDPAINLAYYFIRIPSNSTKKSESVLYLSIWAGGIETYQKEIEYRKNDLVINKPSLVSYIWNKATFRSFEASQIVFTDKDDPTKTRTEYYFTDGLYTYQLSVEKSTASSPELEATVDSLRFYSFRDGGSYYIKDLIQAFKDQDKI